MRDASLDPAVGVYDIYVACGSSFTSINHARHQIAGTIFGNLMDKTGVIIGDGIVVENSGYATLIPSKSVKGPSLTTGQRPIAASVGAGAQYFDITLGKAVWSDGAVWKDAAGTTV